jgi:hypothetical protein
MKVGLVAPSIGVPPVLLAVVLLNHRNAGVLPSDTVAPTVRLPVMLPAVTVTFCGWGSIVITGIPRGTHLAYRVKAYAGIVTAAPAV